MYEASGFLGFVASSAYKEHDKQWARKVGADHNSSLDLFLLYDAVVNTKGDRSRLGLFALAERIECWNP